MAEEDLEYLSENYVPKAEGGLGIQNLLVYNISCLLRYAIDWIAGTLFYITRNIENSLQDKWSLAAMLHSDSYQLLQDNRQHTLFRDTVVAWRTVKRKQGLTPTISQYTPIQQNLNFPPGSEHQGY